MSNFGPLLEEIGSRPISLPCAYSVETIVGTVATLVETVVEAVVKNVETVNSFL